jgi:hypothetical protein
MVWALALLATDPRAGALRHRYHELFPESPEFAVPVEAIVEDLVGLSVGDEPGDVPNRVSMSSKATAWRLCGLGRGERLA